MSLTQTEAEAIRNWVPSPPSPSRVVASPHRERFLYRWPDPPTPTDWMPEAIWTRDGLSYLHNDDLVEVASAILLSKIPHTLCSRPASPEIIKGLMRNLFDYGAPLKMFAYAADVLGHLPRTEAWSEVWRSLLPDHPPLDPYDFNNPEGLHLPSIDGSPHRLPSYFRHLPRTPAHRAELLVLVILAIVAKAVGSPLRPFDETTYWTLGVAGGRWNHQQLVAAEEIFYYCTRSLTFTEEGAWAIKAEMEQMGKLMGLHLVPKRRSLWGLLSRVFKPQTWKFF